MTKISTANSTSLRPLLEQVKQKTKGCKTLDEAAQLLSDIIYEEFRDSLVLARVYATVPFSELPATNRTFVTIVATTNDIMPLIKDDTPILSLLGTRGLKPEWNDRHMSQGHVGIPLASAAFVDQTPMIAELLKEVGLDLDWIDSGEMDIVTKAVGGVSGIFYVQDARQAVDLKGRKVISAQDFVEANDVKTVFGLAGGYPTSKTFITIILFCREMLEKSQVELFVPLIDALKANTTYLASTGAVFAREPATHWAR